MDRQTLVYVDLDGVPHLMGRLWARVRKNKESASLDISKAGEATVQFRGDRRACAT